MPEMNEDMLDMYIEEANENVKQLNDGMLEFEDEGSEEALDAMFRASHTIKSSSASMGFDDVSDLAHSMEDVFDRLQDDEIETYPELFDLLYASVDALEEMVDQVEDTGEAPDKDVSDLLEKLEKAQSGEKIELEQQDQTDDDEFEGVSEIKVGVERLDTLMNLVGELLIVEKKMRRIAEESETDEFNSSLDQLKRLGEDIRNEVSEARMIPVSQVFDRFPRTVRDLSRRTDKEIDFNIEGGDLRMDRTIVEDLGEPIIHMLRNAVDHGIEPAEERREKGKPTEGRITLKAEREGNEAIISVEDDGRGIDTGEVVEKAVEKGALSEDHGEMTEEEKLDLLFDSGMSTNEDVTELSGRGVGLNVVKTKAEELHGSYDVSTEEDEGTRIQMTLPLSLAVVRCFLVEVGDNRYGIPINTILRVLEYDEVDIKMLENSRVFPYEDEEIPVVDLGERLEDDPVDKEEIIVVESGNQRAGILIDSIMDVEDFVSKDLDLLSISGVAGVAMLSDGNPVLILDISEVIGE